MDVMFSVFADQNTHIQVNGGNTDHGKRNFERSSSWTVKVAFSDGNVKKTFSPTGRLMLVSTDYTIL